MNTMKIQVNILLVLVYIVLHNCFGHIYLPHELFPVLPPLPYVPYFFFKKIFKTNLGWTNILGCTFFYWVLVNLPGVAVCTA